MDPEQLHLSGWSEREIAHAMRISKMHPTTQQEHAHLWLLALTLAFGSIGMALALVPVMLFTPLPLSIAVALLLGAGAGMLLCSSLRSLRMTRAHHVRATLIIAASSLLLMLAILQLSQEQLAALPFAATHNALFVALPYVVGLLVPYTLERRLH